MERTNNEQLVRSFLSHQLNTRNRTPATISEYGGVLLLFLDHLGNRSLLNAGLTSLEAFVNRPRKRLDNQPGAPATRARDCAVLRSLYTYLHARGLAPTNPAALLVAPKVNNKNPRPIADTDWVVLWDSLDGQDALRVALGLGFYGGLRCYELLNLTPSMVVWPNVVGFVRKGGDDDILCLGDMLAVFEEKLPHLRADQFQYVLEPYAAKRVGERLLLPYTKLNKVLLRACEAAGIPRYTPHQLRHSTATNLLRAGVPLHLVTKLMAHTSPTVTQRYIKAAGGELREWLKGSTNGNS